MQYDPIKDTPQWKALNSIWKSCSKEQQELLMKDFKVLGEFIRKHTHIDKKCLNKNQNNIVKDDYRYLNDLSKEAKDFVIAIINNGDKNIYHSVMAVINNKRNSDKNDIIEFYFKKYRNKRPYIIENEPLVREIIDLCWERTHSSKQSQNIDNEE